MALPAIWRDYPGHIAQSIEDTLDKYSLDDNGKRVEVTTGIGLLGAPVGSKKFARELFAQ